ncbi:MAG: DUF1800 domain-containing protein [Parvibaculum sp.]
MTTDVDLVRVIAAVRFGLGAGSRDMALMGRDPRGWLIDQIEIPAPQPEPLLSEEGRRDLDRFYETRRAEIAARAGKNPELAEEKRREKRMALSGIRKTVAAAAMDDLGRAVATRQPFRERLSRFWGNHFAVVPKNVDTAGLLPNFEEVTIRPHVTGRFEDMLVAVAGHPAMQFFLDNDMSVGTASKVGMMKGLGQNENLAREILELHTLGVDGGYTQEDVIALSSALTGWTVGSKTDRWSPSFRGARHEPGPVTVLGKTYNQRGEDQLRTILHDLSMHPATARHLCRKLLRHFSSDKPGRAEIEELSSVYLASGGDLAAVVRALVVMDAPWRTPFSKLKQPMDFVASSLRALDIVPDERLAALALEYQELMGQPALEPPGPQGWGDTMEDWNDPSSLLRRAEWSLVAAAAAGDRVEPMEAAIRNFGPAFGDEVRDAMLRAESREAAAAIFLASPLFQRR